MTTQTIHLGNTQPPSHALTAQYPRQQLKSRIVHLGFGAFHRAHQALFTHEMLNAKAEQNQTCDWGICEVNLFGGEQLITDLRQQDHLFTVAEKGKQTELKIIGSVTESLHPSFDGAQAIIEKMAEPQVAIISMTITEKGYCLDPATGKLDINNPLIQADLANPTQPKSAFGYLLQALKLRHARGLAPFSVLSCDNVQDNGHIAKAALLGFSQLLDPTFSQWIAEHVTFPCTMVDRIVPAITEESAHEINQLLGLTDPCAIACEPFKQWVIEDNFVAGRPDWDLAGAQFVADVVPYEEMKLRMLNGSHSFLAYLGYLGGYRYINETMNDAAYRQAALDMMLKAQAPSLKMPEGTDLSAYAYSLIERFSNPNLKHQTWQIAMDGSQKIPQRLFGSLQYHRQQGSDFRHLATAIAGWMRYTQGTDEQGQAIDVQDPKVAMLQSVHQQHPQQVSVVPALMALESIFPLELAQDPVILDAISTAYQSLLNQGAKATVAALNQ